MYYNLYIFRTPEKGVLASNCESELTELMHQIDLLMVHKKQTWENEATHLAQQLALTEQQLTRNNTSIQQKDQEAML